MIHAISTSDWHLEGLVNHFGDEGVDLQLAEIDKIYLYALEHGIKHIFVPGDITDRYLMSDDTKRKLLAFFMKYDGRINTYYIAGNHDRADARHTSMDLIHQFCEWNFLKSLHVYLLPEQKVIDGVVVNFLPHPSKESIAHKRPCLNFVHADIVGALGDNGKPLRTKSNIVVDPRDFTVGGHIHLQQVLESRRLILNGSPYQKNFGESLPKGFLEFRAGYSKGHLRVDYKFVNRVPKFLLETKIISSQQEFAELKSDRYTRYRVIVKDGIVVPANLRARIPNIAQLLATTTAREGEKTTALEVKSATSAIKPGRGLKQFLVSEKFSDEEIKTCQGIFRQALADIRSDA